MTWSAVFYHCKTPLDYISSPESEFYKDNEEITQLEIDYMIETRSKGSVWEITWSWFDNNDKYPKEFAVSENWWKAHKVVSTLIHLRNFGRLDGLEIGEK